MDKSMVVKVGSSVLSNQGRGLDLQLMMSLARQMVALRREGWQGVLVSSGAVAAGVARLGIQHRPSRLDSLQALAAMGQVDLMAAYQTCFAECKLRIAQVLLTYDDLKDRRRYLNTGSVLRRLLGLGVIPIINENDVVATEELRFGDNDTLSALVANLQEARWLVLLTDQAGLYDRHPAEPGARLVRKAVVNEAWLDGAAVPQGGAMGRGGMASKLAAARQAARGGTTTVVAAAKSHEPLLAVAAGQPPGTVMLPAGPALQARKSWLAAQRNLKGYLVVDDGAVQALRHGKRSLLAIGVRDVVGSFERGDMVGCIDHQGRLVAQGLSNYPSQEAMRIMGCPSHALEAVLGYAHEPELIHRDNLVLLDEAHNQPERSMAIDGNLF
jgi:glutamate 5-kinase